MWESDLLTSDVEIVSVTQESLSDPREELWLEAWPLQGQQRELRQGGAEEACS